MASPLGDAAGPNISRSKVAEETGLAHSMRISAEGTYDAAGSWDEAVLEHRVELTVAQLVLQTIAL